MQCEKCGAELTADNTCCEGGKCCSGCHPNCQEAGCGEGGCKCK